MEVVGLVNEAAFTKFERRAESMDFCNAMKSLICFLLSLITILLLVLFGPQYLMSITKEVSLASMDSSKRMYSLNISGFSRLNSFLRTEITFYREATNQHSSTVVINEDYLAYNGKLKVLSGKNFDIKLNISFNQNQIYSDPITIRTIPQINFDMFRTNFHIDFQDGNPLSTKFSIIYSDKAFSIMSIVMRCVLFLIVVILFFRFRKLRITPQTSSISNWIISILIMFSIFATNPFAFLDYFTDKFYIKLIDNFLSQMLISIALFSTFIHILFGEKKNDTPTNTIIYFIIPFITISIIISGMDVLKLLRYQEDIGVVSMERHWAYSFRLFLFTFLFFIHLVYFGYNVLRQSLSITDIDPFSQIIISIFYLTSMVLVERYIIKQGGSFGMSIYPTAITFIYSAFFMFFNWPVEKDIILSDDLADSIPGDTIEVLVNDNEIDDAVQLESIQEDSRVLDNNDEIQQPITL